MDASDFYTQIVEPRMGVTMAFNDYTPFRFPEEVIGYSGAGHYKNEKRPPWGTFKTKDGSEFQITVTKIN